MAQPPRHSFKPVLRSLAAALILLGSACAVYRTPGGAAPADVMTPPNPAADGGIPVVPTPARLVVMRVQGPGYRSPSAQGTNCGRYCAVAETDAVAKRMLDAISRWPSIAQAEALDAGLLPSRLDSLTDLRWAAAKIQADVVFVYTLETSFVVGGRALEPDARLPTAKPAENGARIDCVADGRFLDVRTGAELGQARATASRSLDDAWGSIAQLEERRVQTENAAVDLLLADAQALWSRLVNGGSSS